MHMLHLLRHAKSNWSGDGDDHERPLSRRGREAARRLARGLPAATGRLDLVLCSSARRAGETLELALAFYEPRPHVLVERGLYLASRDRLIERLRQLGEEDENILLIGHNPALHELAVALADPAAPRFGALAAGKFPTAARASFCIATVWAALGRSRPSLVDYATPEDDAGP